MTNQRVSEFLSDLESTAPEQAAIVKSLKEQFIAVNDKLVLDIKYGGLAFFAVDSLIGGIFPYKNHLSVEFSNGADFNDPEGLLQGKGKRRRHLKINAIEDINSKNVSFFIAQAAAG